MGRRPRLNKGRRMSPKSQWQSSPLSPFRYDLRGPGSSQYAARLYLANTSEPSLSPSGRTPGSTTPPEPSPPELLLPSDGLYDVDGFGKKGFELAVRDEMETSDSSSYEGDSPGVDHPQALNEGKQVESKLVSTIEEPSEPNVDPTSTSSFTKPRESSYKDEGGQPSTSASEKSPVHPCRLAARKALIPLASKMNMSHLLPPVFPPPSDIEQPMGSPQPSGICTSAPPMQRARMERLSMLPADAPVTAAVEIDDASHPGGSLSPQDAPVSAAMDIDDESELVRSPSPQHAPVPAMVEIDDYSKLGQLPLIPPPQPRLATVELDNPSNLGQSPLLQDAPVPPVPARPRLPTMELEQYAKLVQSLLESSTLPITAGHPPKSEIKRLSTNPPRHSSYKFVAAVKRPSRHARFRYVMMAGSKRPASEISGDEEPGTSHLEDADEMRTISAQNSNRATITRTKPRPWLSDSVKRAKYLSPSLLSQQELYKIYSMLRQLVQLVAGDFSVVDPHDFIETLSWSHLPPSHRENIAIIRRLHDDIAPRKGHMNKVLIPFRHKHDSYLAFVVLSARPRVVRIFDPDMILRVKYHHREPFSSDWAPGLCVIQFVQTLFPEEPEDPKEWFRVREATAYAAEPIDAAGLVAGCYYEASGWRHPLPNVLPIFLQALHLVIGMDPPTDIIYDLAFAKRLLAAFEGSPDRAAIMDDLRRSCRYFMSVRLGLKIQNAKRTAMYAVGRDSENLHQQALTLKHDANEYIQGHVRLNYSTALDMSKEYSCLDRIISTLDQRFIIVRTQLRYHLCLMAQKFGTDEKESWAAMEALNTPASQALDALESRIKEMRKCLDELRADYYEALEEIGRPEAPTAEVTSPGCEQGDLRETGRKLAARRSTLSVSAHQRLQAAREHFQRGEDDYDG